jgi:hypothetical protein
MKLSFYLKFLARRLIANIFQRYLKDSLTNRDLKKSTISLRFTESNWVYIGEVDVGAQKTYCLCNSRGWECEKASKIMTPF